MDTSNRSHGAVEGSNGPSPRPDGEAMGQAGRFSGQTWGDFELGEVLGRGPHGTVYRARQTSLDRPVAIKVLDVELPEGSGFRKRFLREAVAVAQITSPHVAQIYFASVHHGHPYVAMELVDGADLAARLAGGSRLGDATAFDLMLQATRGLAAAALLGIVHRDLKPSNLLIGRDGVLKLCDFGQVGLVAEDGLAQGAGDMRYASPERAQGQPCDHRSDIHSLGAIFHEMLTGALPDAVRDETTKRRHPMRALNRNIHPDLEALVRSCLAPRPEDRPSSPEALLHALENLLLDGRVYGAGSWGRLRRRRLTVAGVAAGVALLATCAWAASRHVAAAPDRASETATTVAWIPESAQPMHAMTVPHAPAHAPSSASDPSLTEHAERSATERPPSPENDAVAMPSTPALTTASTARASAAPAFPSPEPAHGADPQAASVAAPRPMPIPAPTLTARAAEQVANPEAPSPPMLVRPPRSDAERSSAPSDPAAPMAVAHTSAQRVVQRDPPTSLNVVEEERPAEPSIERSADMPGGTGSDRFGQYADVELLGQTVRFRHCPAGRFLMGSPDDVRPRGRDEDIHQVTLTRGFWLADCECSQALWTSVYGSSPSALQDLDLPVERVSWEAAQDFLSRLERLVPGLHARLPTETEWEYACRAGGADEGDAESLTESGWYAKTSEAASHPLKELRPNGWGLYDMLGNVAEWCEDAYRPYPKPVVVDPPVAIGGSHVIRGGSFRDSADGCRPAHRDRGRAGYCGDRVGLRIALSSLPDAQPRSTPGIVTGKP